MNKAIKYIFSGSAIIILGASVYSSMALGRFYRPAQQQTEDSTEDTLANVKAVGPQFNLKQDPAMPLGDLKPSDGIQLRQPANLKSDVEYDPVTKQYIFTNKIGNINYRPPTEMSMQEYKQYELKQTVRDYWQTQANGGTSKSTKGFRPTFDFQSKAMDDIFGGSTVNIVPQGQAELIFGVNITTTNNPSVPTNLRTTPSFNFDEKIQMNVTGTIGTRLKMGINYNTDATFQFENKTKLDYSGDEDDILKKVEAGNVTLPLPGTLITGSQSLFGVKTDMQFGKLNVVSVISQQQGQSQTIQTQGGSQVTEFSISADAYEANKHFFLAHAFRDTFDAAHKFMPRINSSFTITRVQVWVTNRKNATDKCRDIVAFVDLGENVRANMQNSQVRILKNQKFPDNSNNEIYNEVIKSVRNRTIDRFNPGKYVNGTDYEKLGQARPLADNEFSYDKRLGYISLNTSLNSDEIVGVSFEYQVGGKTFKVGTFAEDDPTTHPLLVKLIKGTNLSPGMPTWDLMMKNIYSLGAYDLNSSDFYLNVLYRNDDKGTDINFIPEDVGGLNNTMLLQLFNFDKVNSQLDAQPDGLFDFIDGVTIDKKYGRVIFPFVEPFGKGLAKIMKAKGASPRIISNYTYQALYDSTQTEAKLIAEKDKFKLKGKFKSSSSSEIYLNAMNVPQGSVKVTCGGNQLYENVDYIVDYNMGTVKIINTGIMSSGQPVQVSLENNSNFAMQTKTLIGSHLDYKINDDFNIGGTVIHLNERPLTQKVNIGEEPVSNTMLGLNSTFKTNSQFLTTMIDKLPFIQTKEMSTITLNTEFADLIPGSPSVIGKNGVAYVDDFESTITTISMLSPYQWYLASTPLSYNNGIDAKATDLSYNYNRAKLSWYTIDPSMVTNIATENLKQNNGKWQKSNYARQVLEQEIFPLKQTANGSPAYIQTLNLTYYPYLKGPYNYNDSSKDLLPTGHLSNPQDRWAGITHPITTTDFEAANIEYIEFWMMDPFVEDKSNPGGELYFDLGDVSEDVLKDGLKSFEQGLPDGASITDSNITRTEWGKIPSILETSPSFSPNAQSMQDIGLDGLNDDSEKTFYSQYVSQIGNILKPQSPNADTAVIKRLLKDPAGDDYRYFKDGSFGKNDDINDRYIDFNGFEGNSPPATTTENHAYTMLPDQEDINGDNTLNDQESFFEYKVDLKPGSLVKGSSYIVDVQNATPKDGPDSSKNVTWYQFKIPLSNFTKYGNISDFKSIRFLRMYLTGFQSKTNIRFGTLDLVRGEWRKYENSLSQAAENITTQPSVGDFDVEAVNIEENANKQPINYVLPPGISRVIDPSQQQILQLNEQSMVLKVDNLADGDARAAYKTTTLDMRQYKKLQMFAHCEKIGNQTLNNNDVSVFIRIGSDFQNNYYEYEVPMWVTDPTKLKGGISADSVWPSINNFVIPLDLLTKIKLDRDKANVPKENVFVESYGDNGSTKTIRVCGTPVLSTITAIMIGVRNPGNKNNPYPNDRLPKSAEIWVDELRLTDFSDNGGWAATGRAQIKLADLGNVRATGSIITPGFGSIEQNVNDRAKEETLQYGLSTDLELGKFFPDKSNIKIPMYASFTQSVVTPKYDPYNSDITLATSIANAQTQAQKDSLINNAETITTLKSLNFTNMKINKMSRTPHFYDPANFSLNLGVSEKLYQDPTTQFDRTLRKEAGFNYIFNYRPKNYTPLQKIGFLNNQYLRIIHDFNFYLAPQSVSFRTNMDYIIRDIKLRDISGDGLGMPESKSIDFQWRRMYDIKYDLTRSLKVDFSINNTSRIIDLNNSNDPNWNTYTDYEKEKRNILQFINGGNPLDYNHLLNVTYTVPINKLPFLDWTNVTARYTATYEWTYEPTMQLTDNGPPISLGNDLKNSQTLQLNGTASLTTIYNKIPFIKDLQRPEGKGKQQQKKEMKTVTFQKTYFNMKAGIPKSITHKLGSEDVKVKVTDANNNVIKGKTEVVSKNRLTFTPDSNATNATVVVEGKVEAGPNPFLIAARITGHILTGVKTISATYNETNSTAFSGYSGNIHDIAAPGLPFMVGIQDTSVVRKMVNKINKNWDTINNPIDYLLNAPFVMSHTKTLNLRLNYEPFPSLKIDLTANHTQTSNLNMNISEDPSGKWMDISSATETGNFSMTVMSFISLEKLSGTFQSHLFKNMMGNQKVIQKTVRANAQKYSNYASIIDSFKHSGIDLNKDTSGYALNSQQVSIPAFLATYGGFNTGNVPMDLFPGYKYMRPNWRVTYDGLSEIPLLKEYFKSVTLSNTFNSTYNIGSYMTNPNYNGLDFAVDASTYIFYPKFDASTVSINEQFSPLIGVDVAWKNNLSTKFEYKKSRTVSLSFSNSSISDLSSTEYVIGAGYRFEQVPLNMIIGAVGANVKSDLNLRADLSLRDDVTMLRQLTDGTEQISAGNKNVKLSISSDYALSAKLKLRLFYDMLLTKPHTSQAFETTNNNFGFSVSFTLTQ